jgi:hypothetical protein
MTEPRTVPGFSAVSLSGSGQVTIEQTGRESLTVTTDDNLLPYIKTDVKGNTLELGLQDSILNLTPCGRRGDVGLSDGAGAPAARHVERALSVVSGQPTGGR